MATAQLNVRIDKDLKAAGDAVLERFGVPAVQIIRDAWQYMAENQRIPQFGNNLAKQDDAKRIDAERRIETQAGMALRLAREAGLRGELETMTFEQLRETAYEEMLMEQGEIHA